MNDETKKTAGRRTSQGGPEQQPRSLSEVQLQFDLNEQIRKLQREEPWQRSGRNAKTLVKYPDLRIVLTVIKKGTRIQKHRTEGRISIQTLIGHIRLRLPDDHVDLPAGHLLALDRGLEHDVEALRNSAFLLSISWPERKE